MKLYDQKHIRDFFNEYGASEDKRWEKSKVEKVKYLVHEHYLRKYLKPGDSVLELGAGPGIFTKEIVNYSGHCVVTDLSPVQLQLNKKRAQKEGYTNKISDWKIIDICDLSAFDSNQFDLVVCFGGPLSYVFEKDIEALKEMHRVLRPNGMALLSVMNLWGSLDKHLGSMLFSISREDNEKIMSTGNLHPSTYTDSVHHCHMYRSEELRQKLEKCGFEVVELSASNCLSSHRAKELEDLENDKEKWTYFLDLEIRACKSPGNIESGTHLIAVVRAR